MADHRAEDDWFAPVPSDKELAEIDTTVAHPARIYDYWLGGKDNYAPDREAAEMAIRVFPDVVESVRANRAFLARAVRFLTAEAGIRQFLDIGTGLPSVDNTHEVAQAAATDARVVYVDNDPIVLTHARALLTSTPEGGTAYIDADLRDPRKILDGAAATLDFAKPIAVMLVAILHFILDEQDPYGIVARLMDAVPAGSYLVMSHITKDVYTKEMTEFVRNMSERGIPAAVRTRAEVTRFFDGLDLVEPGVVLISQWRPGTEAEPTSPAALWGGVARKP